MTDPVSVAPATGVIAVSVRLKSNNYLYPLVAGLVAATLTLGAHLLLYRRTYGSVHPFRARIPEIQGWTFSGSWVTNLAAIGTLLSSTGLIEDLVLPTTPARRCPSSGSGRSNPRRHRAKTHLARAD